MLETTIGHIENDDQFKDMLAGNENVMICCGRNGPMCMPVYDVMENLDSKHENVTFRVMEFDHPVSHNIRSLSEVADFMGLPFTVYFKDGKVVEATSSVQSKTQVASILKEKF